MRRIILALMACSAIAAGLAAIPSSAGAWVYGGCIFKYPTSCWISGPQTVYLLYTSPRTQACSYFGPHPENGFYDPCPNGPERTVCGAVDSKIGEPPPLGWNCGQGLITNEYLEPGPTYGYAMIGGADFEGWLYDYVNWPGGNCGGSC